MKSDEKWNVVEINRDSFTTVADQYIREHYAKHKKLTTAYETLVSEIKNAVRNWKN